MRILTLVITLAALLALACGGGGRAQPTSRPIALLATSTSPPTAPATAEPAAETLAFIREGDIWLVDADGENERRLGLSGVNSFSWVSPDELYVVTGDDPPDQFLVDLEGELYELRLPALAPVDVGPSDFIPRGSWSRDGTLYVAPVDDQLIVLRRDGSEVTRLDMSLEANPEGFCAGAPIQPGTTAKVILGLPVFAPDAETVVVAAYCSNADPNSNPQNQNGRLYRVSVGSGVIEPLELSTNLRNVTPPGISPDGSQIAQLSGGYGGLCNFPRVLSVANADGANSRFITPAAVAELLQEHGYEIAIGGPTGFDWSPTGNALVVSYHMILIGEDCSSARSAGGLYIVPLDESPGEQLADGPTRASAWSSSGRSIAYVEGEAFGEVTEPPTVHILDLITRDVIDVGLGSQPAWQPQP